MSFARTTVTPVALLALALVSSECVHGPANAGQRASTNVMPRELESVDRLLTRFDDSESEGSESITLLEDAWRTLQRVPESDETAKPTEARRGRTEMWLRLLGTIEERLDPNFDPQDFPQLNVVPPPSADGVQFPSGVDPRAIDDPAARKAYEAAVKQNEEKAQRSLFQIRLRLIENSVLFDVAKFLRSSYAPSPRDQRELERLLSESTVEASTQQQLRENLAR